jgi:hypothetical protein
MRKVQSLLLTVLLCGQVFSVPAATARWYDRLLQVFGLQATGDEPPIRVKKGSLLHLRSDEPPIRVKNGAPAGAE